MKFESLLRFTAIAVFAITATLTMGCKSLSPDSALASADQGFRGEVGTVVMRAVSGNSELAADYQEEFTRWQSEGSDWTTWNFFAPEYLDVRYDFFSEPEDLDARQQAHDVIASWEQNLENRIGEDATVWEMPAAPNNETGAR